MRAVSHAYRDADDIRAELPLFFRTPEYNDQKGDGTPTMSKTLPKSIHATIPLFLRFHTSS